MSCKLKLAFTPNMVMRHFFNLNDKTQISLSLGPEITSCPYVLM